jgi:ATP-dependent Clp protease protease subunit
MVFGVSIHFKLPDQKLQPDMNPVIKNLKQFAVKHQGISSNTLNDYNKYVVTNLISNIIEERPMNVAVMDVYSRLMMDRIIFLGYPLNDEVANIITAQMLFLESTDRHRDIQMYINCPGGSVYSGLGVYDTMQYITPDVSTICIGMAASMAAVLMCAGTKGKRTALKHSRIMNATSPVAQLVARLVTSRSP